MIPQQFIDDLLRRVDVVEVVGQHVQLKRTGANYSGLCPFHTEKSPSFSVSPSKQFYHCFGCGAHGTALGFLIEHLGLPFPQAVEDLARRVGLEVPRQANDIDPEQKKQETDRRTRLKSQLLEAAKFYQRRLKDSPHAVDYLKKRGLSGEIAAKYHLGYSPEGWQPLQAVFGDYASKDLVDAGLVIEGEAGKRYDRFRDRIMFPILSPRGEVLGFGARTLGSDEPKYLNSPETPVFSKGYELYGVFEGRAAIRESGQVWVVEGYMDVVALAQHGLGHAVATLGTATTPQHMQALLRLSDHIVFMFDGDNAGRRAAARALETALPFASEKNRIDFAFLPQEHDPDSFVREHGAQALKDWVAKAKPLSAWLIDLAAQDQPLELPEGRAAAASEAQRLLGLMQANALRAQIAREIARRFDVSEASVIGTATALSPRAYGPRGEGLAVTGASNRHRDDRNPDSRHRDDRNPDNRHREPEGRGGPRPQWQSAPRRTPPVIRPLAERVLQIIVRCPEWAYEIDAESSALFDDTQLALIEWIKTHSPAGAKTSFAVLHEAALAQGRERGPEEVRLFIKLARPDPALDQLIEESPDQALQELSSAIGRMKLRALQEEATRLAALAATDPGARAELALLHQKIHSLKA
jgi:DNA primase